MRDTFSISALGRLFRMDRRDVSKALENVPPAGQERGHPVWSLEDAAPVLVRPVQGKSAPVGSVPAVPEGYEFLDAIRNPVDAAAAYAMVALAYRLPALAASLAVGSGASLQVAFTLYQVMQLAVTQTVADLAREISAPPWSYDEDPGIWQLDHFAAVNWQSLAEGTGEKMSRSAWKRHAQRVFGPDTGESRT